MPSRPAVIVTLLLAGLPLGCGGGPETALVDPAKFRFHTCTQLQREMTKLRDRAQELRALYEKAQRDSVIVARVSYEADYLSTIGDMQLIEAEAQERKCDPPIMAAASPSPLAPTPGR